MLPSPTLPPRPFDGDVSDYSDVGDFAADADFYVPGVNDRASPPKSVLRKRQGDVPQVDHSLVAASDAARDASDDDHSNSQRPHFSHPHPAVHASASPSHNAQQQQHQSHSASPNADHSPSQSPAPDLPQPDSTVQVVRQNSNFSRLSAQSWLTVDSAHEVDVNQQRSPSTRASPAPPPQSIDKAATPPVSVPLYHGSFSDADDFVPQQLFDIDVRGSLLRDLRTKPYDTLSVLECCALLQEGVAALKKKNFLRFGARRVWLNAVCDKLMWTSKKAGAPANHINIQQVARVKCTDRELTIFLIEGRRISLLFANADEAAIWVRALSCLVPLQARISAPTVAIPPEKEREEFTLSHDLFEGRSLRQLVSISNYVLLCSAKDHPVANGHKVAFARSDSSFCTLRYIPRKIVPLLLRSQEEIAVLKRLKHPNIVHYRECLLDQQHGGTYVTFEYLARGTLMDASKLEGVQPIPENSARELIRDVVNALEYLHTLRIAHADVRPDNLLRSVDGAVKLNPIGCITHDFTEIKNLTSLVKTRLGDASPAFLAPELCWLCEAPPAHPKSYAMDVWAVGAVLYFMLYGRVPFGGRDDHEIQTAICTKKLRFPRHPETSKKVRSLLKGVLGEKDPKTRVGLSELKRHPWFAEGEPHSNSASSTSSKPLIRLTVPPEEIYYAVQRAKITMPPDTS